TVVNTPVASATGTLFASWLWPSQRRATTSSNSASAVLSPVSTVSVSPLSLTSLSSLESPAWSTQPPTAQRSPPTERTASAFMPDPLCTAKAKAVSRLTYQDCVDPALANDMSAVQGCTAPSSGLS